MHSGPPKIVESLIALLIPPACREEVTGDLHERYRSPLQYIADLLCTVPLVILSRIRRTADLHVLLIQAAGEYLCFLCIASLLDASILNRPMRPALYVAAAIVGLILNDVYARDRSAARNLFRGPVLGAAMVMAFHIVLRLLDSELILPLLVVLEAVGLATMMSATIRMWFPPFKDKWRLINATAAIPDKTGQSPLTRIFRAIGLVLVVLLVGTIMYQVTRHV